MSHNVVSSFNTPPWAASGSSGGSIALERGGYYGAQQQMEKNKKDGMGAR